MFDTSATKEDLKLGYKHGFKSVIEYIKSLGQTQVYSYFIISPLTKYLCLFSSNSDTTIVNQAVFSKHHIIQGSTCPVIV